MKKKSRENFEHFTRYYAAIVAPAIIFETFIEEVK